MTREFIDFVLSHENEDTARLLLSASRYPDIDMPAAVQQIEGRRAARDKWPGLLQCEEFLYPPRLNREQASSEAVASKRVEACLEDLSLDGHFVADPATLHVADLTGGMGIDTLAWAKMCKEVEYVEHDMALCSLMEHNRLALGVDNLRIHHDDSIEWLQARAEEHRVFDIIFIDPARRDNHGRKMVGFDSCDPNILEHLPLLRRCCRFLIVKASPMIDIDLGCRQLKKVENVFILAYRGECKEVAFMCSNTHNLPLIHSIVADADNRQYFCFTRSEERDADLCLADEIGEYLYEPNAAVMKAGPYAMLCQEYDVDALARNTHLFTADYFVENFPGRIFHVLREVALNKKAIKEILPDGKAHVVTRNYPVPAADLQRQLGLHEGGDLFVVATTVGSRRCGLLCERF